LLDIFYDYFKVNGGAEKVTLEMMRIKKDCRVWVDHIDTENFTLDRENDNHIYELKRFAHIGLIEHFLVPLRFLSFHRKKCIQDDVAIFSGNYAPLGALRTRYKKKLFYCHTPPRHWFDLSEYYRRNCSFWTWIAIKLQKWIFEAHYARAINKMDVVIANSANVQNRLKKYFDVESIVIHPPIDLTLYNWLTQEDFYVSTARHEDYKSVDRIISAFKNMPDKKLVIASGGSQTQKLKQLAIGCNNISFTGWLDSIELSQLIGRCIATIYLANDEDFGMSPVESMAAGKPVIGQNSGGLRETIIHNETGFLLDEYYDENSIINAVFNMSAIRAEAMRRACENRSLQFAKESFHEKMNALLEL